MKTVEKPNVEVESTTYTLQCAALPVELIRHNIILLNHLQYLSEIV